MGLDIALGVIVLVWALRGWLKGFLDQALQLTGLVAGVYAAGPIRDLAMPRLAPHLPSVDPSILQRLVWWSAAVLSWVIVAGLGSMLLKLSRKRPAGMAPEPSYSDQSAGLLLGLIKAGVATAFLVAAIDQHALNYLKGAEWAEDYVTKSHALAWSREYKPAELIWKSQPVRSLVAMVRKGGIDSGEAKSTEKSLLERVVSAGEATDSGKRESASKGSPADSVPPKLELDRDIDRLIEEFRGELDKKP